MHAECNEGSTEADNHEVPGNVEAFGITAALDQEYCE